MKQILPFLFLVNSIIAQETLQLGITAGVNRSLYNVHTSIDGKTPVILFSPKHGPNYGTGIVSGLNLYYNFNPKFSLGLGFLFRKLRSNNIEFNLLEQRAVNVFDERISFPIELSFKPKKIISFTVGFSYDRLLYKGEPGRCKELNGILCGIFRKSDYNAILGINFDLWRNLQFQTRLYESLILSNGGTNTFKDQNKIRYRSFSFSIQYKLNLNK